MLQSGGQYRPVEFAGARSGEDMLRELSQDMVAGLKDTLRDVRHRIRTKRPDRQLSSGRHAAPAGFAPAHSPRGEVDRVLGRVAVVMDDALTLAETVSLSLAPSDAARGMRLRKLETYFPGAGAARLKGERLFRREMYQGVKEVLRRQGVADARIHEARFLTVHAAVRQGRADLLEVLRTTRPDGQLEATAAICATLLVEMLASKPVQFEGIASEPSDADNDALRCLAPLVLAYGIATLEPAGISDGEILEAAMLAADARHERIAAALRGAQPVDELTRLFTPLLAHLP